MSWYLTITSEMREDLQLKGNELLVYALIHGYSQAGQGCYYGSLAHICNVCGLTKKTVITILKSLNEQGLISRREVFIEGVKRVFYSVIKGGENITPCGENITPCGENITPCGENITPCGENITPPTGIKITLPTGIKITPNNKYNINNNTLSIKEKGRFCKPSVEEVAAYCAERNNGVNAESFFNFYESKGWVIGKSPMKDWKAAVRTWEQREDNSVRRTRNANSRRTAQGNTRGTETSGDYPSSL